MEGDEEVFVGERGEGWVQGERYRAAVTGGPPRGVFGFDYHVYEMCWLIGLNV